MEKIKGAIINKIIIDSLTDYFEGIDEKIDDLNLDTELFGKGGILDSMGLVNLIVDIESRLFDEDMGVYLTSEKAMSKKNSPFKTIRSLTDFIAEQLEQENE